MMVISSQRYLDEARVEAKRQALQGVDHVDIPIVYAGDYDGQALYIMLDGHHTMAAARELGIQVRYIEISRSEAGDADDATLDEMCELHWMDSDWYDVETGRLVF